MLALLMADQTSASVVEVNDRLDDHKRKWPHGTTGKNKLSFRQGIENEAYESGNDHNDHSSSGQRSEIEQGSGVPLGHDGTPPRSVRRVSKYRTNHNIRPSGMTTKTKRFLRNVGPYATFRGNLLTFKTKSFTRHWTDNREAAPPELETGEATQKAGRDLASEASSIASQTELNSLPTAFEWREHGCVSSLAPQKDESDLVNEAVELASRAGCTVELNSMRFNGCVCNEGSKNAERDLASEASPIASQVGCSRELNSLYTASFGIFERRESGCVLTANGSSFGKTNEISAVNSSDIESRSGNSTSERDCAVKTSGFGQNVAREDGRNPRSRLAANEADPERISISAKCVENFPNSASNACWPTGNTTTPTEVRCPSPGQMPQNVADPRPNMTNVSRQQHPTNGGGKSSGHSRSTGHHQAGTVPTVSAVSAASGAITGRMRRERRPTDPVPPPPPPPPPPPIPPTHAEVHGSMLNPELLPDILNSHLPPPYSTLPHATEHSSRRGLASPLTPTGPLPPSSPRRSRTDRFALPRPSGRRGRARSTPRGSHYTPEDEPKHCCGVAVTQTVSIRWFIVMIAFVGLCCAVVGTVLGALKATGREHLTVSLLMIGVGIVLITVSGIAWRLTSHDAPSCRMMLGLHTEEPEPNRRFVPRVPPSYGRPHHPYAAMMYPEFQYRPPPPSYQASMQEYRLRLLLLDRHHPTPSTSLSPVSPPPTYRSNTGNTSTFARPPIQFTRDNDYSRPPSYRSRASSVNPCPNTDNLNQNGVGTCGTQISGGLMTTHSRDPSLSLSLLSHESLFDIMPAASDRQSSSSGPQSPATAAVPTSSALRQEPVVGPGLPAPRPDIPTAGDQAPSEPGERWIGGSSVSCTGNETVTEQDPAAATDLHAQKISHGEMEVLAHL